MSNLSLFEPEIPPERERLAEKLRQLASRNIWIGTSSWKYEGWLGRIYSRERYQVRGRFSKRRFEETCLAEYAETFPIVCGDFSFYQFPSADYWQRLFQSAPESLRYAFKVPEEVTVKVFPVHSRYGPRAGQENSSFLNADLFAESFLRPLETHRNQVSVLIFEFGTFSRSSYAGGEAFLADLDPFLAALPQGFRYAVEIRNPEFLGPEYFGCLRGHGIAHTFNAWTRMPELGRQISLPGAFTADFAVTRALLRFGRPYEQAVRKFSPYADVQEPDPEAREALRSVARRAGETSEHAFLFVNNRLEGYAPGTIQAVVEDL